mmetsp:Transcript_10474/g.22488  ORF Transcript_10474/g.22488 Transcript_10474/m.22488 type:complete len:214 (+) Transcript_10474:191-832(+)
MYRHITGSTCPSTQLGASSMQPTVSSCPCILPCSMQLTFNPMSMQVMSMHPPPHSPCMPTHIRTCVYMHHTYHRTQGVGAAPGLQALLRSGPLAAARRHPDASGTTIATISAVHVIGVLRLRPLSSALTAGRPLEPIRVHELGPCKRKRPVQRHRVRGIGQRNGLQLPIPHHHQLLGGNKHPLLANCLILRQTCSTLHLLPALAEKSDKVVGG